MIPVPEARARILDQMTALGTETVPLNEATGRVLAADITARRTQPPLAVSAMDGYAVRGADVAAPGAQLTMIGRVAAGDQFKGRVGEKESVRLFTGAPIPDGADTVVIQEDVEAPEGSDTVLVRIAAQAGAHIRKAGQDFLEGNVLIEAGTRLAPHQIALAAAGDWPDLPVYVRPRIAVLATGDELVRPGMSGAASSIVASSLYGMLSLLGTWQVDGLDLGIARDTTASLEDAFARAEKANLLVTLGGASVGDHDLVQETLKKAGGTLDFWRIAMRPGKPLMFATLGETPVLGLPGNPVSAMVCARLFLKPAVEKLSGLEPKDDTRIKAKLGRALGANGVREDYMRTRLERDETGAVIAKPFPVQDSSMLSILAQADGLLVRPPNAPPAEIGSPVEVLPL